MENTFKNYYVFEQENEVFYNTFEDSTAMFVSVSKAICFSDCSDIEIKSIYTNGEKVYYKGWQPNMFFEFATDDGKIVFSAKFPEWEH